MERTRNRMCKPKEGTVKTKVGKNSKGGKKPFLPEKEKQKFAQAQSAR